MKAVITIEESVDQPETLTVSVKLDPPIEDLDSNEDLPESHMLAAMMMGVAEQTKNAINLPSLDDPPQYNDV